MNRQFPDALDVPGTGLPPVAKDHVAEVAAP